MVSTGLHDGQLWWCNSIEPIHSRMANFQARGSFDFETVSGTIELRVPAGLAADFDAETFSGKITNELGPAPKRSGQILPSQELSFSTGSGGARISLQSFSGAIRIRKE